MSPIFDMIMPEKETHLILSGTILIRKVTVDGTTLSEIS